MWNKEKSYSETKLIKIKGNCRTIDNCSKRAVVTNWLPLQKELSANNQSRALASSNLWVTPGLPLGKHFTQAFKAFSAQYLLLIPKPRRTENHSICKCLSHGEEMNEHEWAWALGPGCSPARSEALAPCTSSNRVETLSCAAPWNPGHVAKESSFLTSSHSGPLTNINICCVLKEHVCTHSME